MGIGEEFWKDSIKVPDDKIQFITDNYKQIMKIYREIEKQDKKTYDKKVSAHNEIQKLRDVLEKNKTRKKKLTKKELISIEEKIEELEKIREEDDLIFVDGSPLTYTQIVALIREHKYLLKFLSEIDSKVRPRVANTAETLLTYVFYPFVKLTNWVGLSFISEMLKDIPKDIKESMTE